MPTQEQAQKLAAVYYASYTPRPANAPADAHEMFGVVPRPASENLMHLVNADNNGGMILIRVQNPSDKAWLARIREEFATWAQFSPIQQMELFEDRFPSPGEGKAASSAEGEPPPPAQDKRYGAGRKLETRPDRS